MLRWMLRVDNWLNVTPLENMEGDPNLPFVLEIFHLKLYSRDLSFEALTLEIFPLKFSKFLMKICSLEIFPWKIEIFFWRVILQIYPLKYGDFSLKIHFGDFSIPILKNFNEDLFIGDFSLKNSFGDFSFDDFKI